MLVVYVDDIVITRDDIKGIDSLNKYLRKHFQIKRSWIFKILLRH